MPQIDGTTNYPFHGGAAVLGSDQPISFSSVGGATYLTVAPGQAVSVRFRGPAWWTVVRGRPTGDLVIQGLAGGNVKIEAPIHRGSAVEWRTRGMDEIRIVGDGALESIQYQPLDVKRGWAHVTHLCLPVLDPRYGCAPMSAGSTNEEVAQNRVPATVDWAARYSPGYTQDLDPLLVALAAGTPPPVTNDIVASPSSTSRPPTGGVSATGALDLAMFDPHMARVVGMLYDDPVPVDGTAWAYRVTGTWDGPWRRIPLTRPRLQNAGLSVTIDGQPFPSSLRRGDLTAAATVTVDTSTARTAPLSLEFTITSGGPVRWTLIDVDGNQHGDSWRRSTRRTLNLRVASVTGRPIAAVTLDSQSAFSIGEIRLPGRPVRRSSILPYVVAGSAPPPAGPSTLTVDIDTPGGGGSPSRAALRWDVPAPVDAFSGGPVSFQAAAAQLSVDPTTTPPPAPPFDDRMLLDSGALLIMPRDVVASGDPMAIDRPLPEGWRAWWVRGVDLFGRVSSPAGPEVRVITDTGRPPPPVILAAEYVQPSLDPQLATLLGRSSAGDAWAAAQPAAGGQSAAIVTFGWTPELHTQCGDVDAFRIYARTPNQDGTWSSRPWGNPIAHLGSFPVRYDGTVSNIATNLASLNITAVEPLDDTHSRCSTDVAIDVAGGLAGCEVVVAAATYAVTSHGEGDLPVLVLAHPIGNPPPTGPATLRAGPTGVRMVTSTIAAPSLSSNPHRGRLAGVLVSGQERHVVLAETGGVFLASPIGNATPPASGDAISWYPAYRVAVADSGFGPVPTTATPHALAQVAVTSVRRSTIRPAESPPSIPATIHAVDATPPPAPTLPIIPTGEKCAQLASAADWHGISRFDLTWHAVTGATGYHVHRAMDDAVRHADVTAHGIGAGSQPHQFPTASLPTEAGRRAAVVADLASIDAALVTGDPDPIRTAYRAARADAWQLIASQDDVAGAFTLLNGVPTAAGTTVFEDRFDGAADSHWFYRVSSRNAGGLESELSLSTPPICAPRTTPPRPPRALLALAGDASVRLRFAPSASADIARYCIYRTFEPELARDVRDMLEQARLTATPSSPPTTGHQQPLADGNAFTWTDNAATPGREWFYRIVAEDPWGNRSEPSTVLAARSLHPMPPPPVWIPPVRVGTTISLTWTHVSPRMASRIERRTPNGMWREISGGWLPRGQYQFDDSPPDAIGAWEYRLTVKDHAGQFAAITPVITVAGVTP